MGSAHRSQTSVLNEIHARSEDYLKSIRGHGRSLVLRQLGSPLFELVEGVDHLPEHIHRALRPRQPLVDHRLAADIPETIREFFAPRPPPSLTDAEILQIVRALGTVGLEHTAVIERIRFHRQRINELGDQRRHPPGGRQHAARASRAFLEAVGKTLAPTRGGRPKAHNDLLVRSRYKEQLAFSKYVHDAYLAAGGAHSTDDLLGLGGHLYHTLRWLEEVGEYDEKRTLTAEETKDFLGRLCAVVTAPGTKTPAIIDEPRWIRATTRAFVCSLFDLDVQSLDRALSN